MKTVTIYTGGGLWKPKSHDAAPAPGAAGTAGDGKASAAGRRRK